MTKTALNILISLLFSIQLQHSVQASELIIITFADARADGGIRQSANIKNPHDSPGNIFVFDQKLLAKDANTVIGRNAGYCIRTDPGATDFSNTDHPLLADDPDNNYSQCNWTLSFNKNSNYNGSLTVSGREADLGSSHIAIIGGTGDFTSATGVLISTPVAQKNNGMLFRQELRILTLANKKQ